MTEPHLVQLKDFEDDRGVVYCALDNINVSMNIDENYEIKRTYVVKNWSKGMVRAWHGHKKGWTGLHVFKGVAKILARRIDAPLNTKTFVLSDRKPGIVWVPPGWYNGHMSLEDDTRILVYSTLTFEEVKKDDVRKELIQSDIEDFFEVTPR